MSVWHLLAYRQALEWSRKAQVSERKTKNEKLVVKMMFKLCSSRIEEQVPNTIAYVWRVHGHGGVEVIGGDSDCTTRRTLDLQEIGNKGNL